ncbi:UbiX family flavin prenyltransferase [Microbacterium marinilacus]|uniref:Flavin prenyltransferase UbiX n=1 Tax=Microbacterium marinilacus TaxID=415209 RepID=A0ABP7BVZ1_9MICO|nr:UbiX family flavin prenyltransferase [Microbacterium marinilacus]MBY0688237.1 UbiX family flavin prenyltransferase [Microbacterium marinilacus]
MTAAARRIVVGISGASGAALGVRVLELARGAGYETHLVVSRGARATITSELGMSPADVAARADVVHADGNLGATIASGSFRTAGMIVAPCSIKTLSAIANSHADTLLSRAADVTLKERRPLVLMVRETPLHRGHLRLMSLAAESGAVIFPPVPAFYNEPQTIADVVDTAARRALEQAGVFLDDTTRWAGMQA